MSPEPTADGRIVASGLTKLFGEIKAVDGLSFSVEPGSVTGFLGPNGAGKTTTLRMILGLATPTAGTGTINGVTYAHLPDPGRTVGAVLEATSFHPGRSARNHLRVFCAAAGLPDKRADEVLEWVGLTQAARYPVRGFSLGMRQRLGLATALLGNPRVLLLDEPANGLDPEGIAWLRGLLRHFADVDGRTVLISSHVLSEVEQTVDRVVIIARGRLIYEGKLADLEGASAGVVVRTPTPESLSMALAPLHAKVTPRADGSLAIVGATPEAVGRLAWEAHVELHELRAGSSSLEETFLRLTAEPSAPTEPTQ
ncbi:MAG TPA: ABC transporter ATP-binding protein [Candidatus Dormibacteraeota bacterium]